MGTSSPDLVNAHHVSSAEDEMPAQKTSAHEKPSTLRIATARRTQLDELYLAYDVTGVKPLELEAIERRAIANAVRMPGGYAVTTVLGAEDEIVEERLTVLTSVQHGSRVAAALYTVRIGDALMKEFEVQVRRTYDSLCELASHVACHVL
jgi:hypothetical protein